MISYQVTFNKADIEAIAKKADYINLAVLDALKEYGDNVFNDSQNLVPVDTGNLQASGHIDIISGKGFPEVAITYDAPYALYIHEDLQLNHPNGGQAKYIEQPMDERLPELRRGIIDRVNAVLYGGKVSSASDTSGFGTNG